jgi:hypothetical protein
MFKVCYSWIEFLDICCQYKFTSKENYIERYKVDPILVIQIYIIKNRLHGKPFVKKEKNGSGI